MQCELASIQYLQDGARMLMAATYIELGMPYLPMRHGSPNPVMFNEFCAFFVLAEHAKSNEYSKEEPKLTQTIISANDISLQRKPVVRVADVEEEKNELQADI
ncbi:hypothetical protein CCR75_004565 [Bremia lactucae]|uniref:Uncharacterized protein n=1 Tax=Bremia lactucae TaxID=4779 RepID=A0A976IIN1_BRELC|nr:hypothetical protein CCR75_004565 [Bremia lactucae]